MRNEPHSPSWISMIRVAVEDWRREKGWSRETVCQAIVDSHERLGCPGGIFFDPPTRDAFERQKVNAERIYRWLDDVSKDKNLLPANFIISILGALPNDYRAHLADELLAPADLAADHIEPLDHLEGDGDKGDEAMVGTVHVHFRTIVEHSSQVHMSMASMLDGIDPGEPENAKKRLTIAAGTFRRAIGLVNRILKRGGKK
ncbi:MAG TPA: hypothetical protein VJ576_09635 [Rhodocyclaceae bacterium]|nr:hypothetical protein [Rhodocyclaceae bacterium]